MTNNTPVDLDRLAEEELLRESKRAVARAEIIGIEGFKKCPLPRTNKRFLSNTIVNNIKSNKIKESRWRQNKDDPVYTPHVKRDTIKKSKLEITKKLSRNVQKSNMKELQK